MVLVVGLASTARADSCVHYSDCPGLVPECVGAFCIGGQCLYTIQCDDSDPCTIDHCVPGVGCGEHEPLCPSDGFACNGVEHCFAPVGQPPICVPGTPVSCDDHDACTIDAGCMEPGGCSFGVVDCQDDDPCTQDGCDPTIGCTHEPIAGCCHDAAECPTDACVVRRCEEAVCTAGTPVSCDDDDPATVDACDPVAGCTHTTRPIEPPPCAADGDCPADDEPCTAAACDPLAGCVTRAVEGYDIVACVCRRTIPPTCAKTAVPRAVTVRTARACTLVDRAARATARKSARLLRRAGGLWSTARKRLAAAPVANTACRDDLGAQLADAASRAASARR
jgi:hypothetical protein